MLSIQEVVLNVPVEQIVSRPGIRVNCDVCGEEIMNEREVHQHGLTLCIPCAQGGYCQSHAENVLRVTQVEEV